MKEQSASIEDTQQKPAELTGREALLLEIAHKLSQSREASGDSIEEAVRKLKLRKSHIVALESGNWDKMPDDIYVLGFLRQYSQHLNVDLSDEIHRLKHDQYALTKPLTFPDPPVAPSRRWAWIGGIAFLLLFILFNVASENQRGDDQDTAESAGLPAIIEPALDATPVLQPTDNSKTTAGRAQANRPDSASETFGGTPTPTNPAIISASPAETTISEAPVAEKSSPIKPVIENITTAETKSPTTQKPTTQKQTGTASVPAQTTNKTHHFRFDAVGSPVWLQISRPDPDGDGKGSLLKEVLLQPGVHATIHAQTGSLWITCGNAPALRISVDGTVLATAGSLGTGKKVLRDYRFSIGDKQ